MAVVFDGGGSFRRRPHNNQLVQHEGGTARGQEGGVRQCNNQLMFHHATTTICGIVICHAAMALPGIVVCNAAMAIHGIVFACTAMATSRNRVMATEMAVALEEEGNGKGRKSNGNCNKESNGKQQQLLLPQQQ